MRWAPMLFGVLALTLWEAAVRIGEIPVYILPGPIATISAFVADPAGLLQALASTLFVTFTALLVAAVVGAAMAVAMSASRLAQAAIQPWAVALQVTPLPAIAPLIIIWVGDPFVAMVVCATIIAFFPLFANTATGLASAPPELNDLFRLYGAGRWRTMAFPAVSPPGWRTASLRPASGWRCPACSLPWCCSRWRGFC
jgi:NitT/TauT family transport system permease protein